MQRAFVVVTLLTCAVFVFSQTPAALSTELDIHAAASRAAVDRAVRALEVGDSEGALAAVDEGRALDPSNADAHYIYALSVLRAGRPLPEAETELRLSLTGCRFLQYSQNDASRLLAHILIRTKRSPEALTLIARPALDADSDTLYLRAQALRAMGNTDAFLSTLDSSLDRFPSDARIVRELLSYAARVPRTEAIASRIRRVEGRLGYYRYLDPELIRMLVPFRASEADRRDLLLEYRAMGKRNPAAVPAALELGILDDAAASTEFFSFPALSWADLRELRSLLRDDAGRSAFANAFAGYSGKIGYDSDGDGFYETLTTYNKGEIEEWALDFDQDGVPEADFRFRENLPDSGKMQLSGAEAYIEYGTYPYLSKIRFSTAAGMREYLFSPDALAFPVVALSVEANGKAGNEYAPQRTTQGVPTDTACAAAAYRVTERSAAASEPVRITDVDKGIPVRSLIRTEDGRSGILVYRNGHPLYELADMDGDGLFESRYFYDTDATFTVGSGKQPAPSRFEGDFDLDGAFEYHEDLNFPFLRTWDYNGDGRIDAQASALKEGGELWEFSRRFDGRLDTAIIVRDGRIARVIRGGVEISLTSDSGGKVLWVGEKPFDFGRVEPAAGIGKRGGFRYRVIRFGDQLIAEAVE
jgi:hypothetical protein